MNIQLCCFGFQLYSQAKNILSHSFNYHNNKQIVFYNSNSLNNIQMSFETLYNYLKSKDFKLNETLFMNENTKNIILLTIESLRTYCKIKEFFQLKKIGFPFYIDKNVFYENILNITEEQYLSSIQGKNSQMLSIIPKRGKIIIPVLNECNIDIPNILNYPLNEKKKNLFKKVLSISDIGEIVYILKPIIYMTLYVTLRNNPGISMIVNAILDFIVFIFQKKTKNLTFSISKAYKNEMFFRKRKLLMYLLRKPIFDNFTMPFIIKIFTIIKLPNIVVQFILQIINYYQLISYISN